MEPDSGRQHPLETPSEVRYVLSGQPRGLAAMAEVVRTYGEDKIKETKEDVDTLLVFAGLFSAVLTAFLIESYPNLMPQTNTQMLLALQQIVLQTSSYTLVNGALNSTSQPPLNVIPEPFRPTDVDIRINVLWFSSLVVSLVTASFGILVKQWLREYLAVANPSSQARLWVRHFRHPELVRWKVIEIAAVLPLLQQIALGLFFLGLCYFAASVHESVGHTTLPLVAGWAFCFFIVTIMPLFAPKCPYKTTLLKTMLLSLHLQITNCTNTAASRLYWYSWGTLPRAWQMDWSLRFSRFLAQHAIDSNEHSCVRSRRADMDILAAVDALQANDELLATTFAEALQQIQPRWGDVVTFVLRLLGHRLQRRDLGLLDRDPVPLDLQALTRHGRDAVVDILVHDPSAAISRYHRPNAVKSWEKWSEAMWAFYILFSPSPHPLPQSAATVLKKVLEHHGAGLCRTLVFRCPRTDSKEPQEDYFSLLLRGALANFRDTDIPIALSLQCFEAMMHARFDHARPGPTRASGELAGGNNAFTLQSILVLERLPWREAVSATAVQSAWDLITSITGRAIDHAISSAGNPTAGLPGKQLETRNGLAHNNPSALSGVIDGLVAICNISYIGDTFGQLVGTDLNLVGICVDCLSGQDSAVALVKALFRMDSRVAHCVFDSEWAWDIGAWQLQNNTQLKLNNLLGALSIVHSEWPLSDSLLADDDTTVSPPPTALQFLSLCVFVLSVFEQADAVTCQDQWRTIFSKLTQLGQRISACYQSDHPCRLSQHPVHGEQASNSHTERDETAEAWGGLAAMCISRLQGHDVKNIATSDGEDAPPDYDEWAQKRGHEDPLIEDDFVWIVGLIYENMARVATGRERPISFRMEMLERTHGVEGKWLRDSGDARPHKLSPSSSASRLRNR